VLRFARGFDLGFQTLIMRNLGFGPHEPRQQPLKSVVTAGKTPLTSTVQFVRVGQSKLLMLLAL
jgi:hypothetical protein